MMLLYILIDIILIFAADSLAYFLRFAEWPFLEHNELLTLWPYILLIRIFYLYAKGMYRYYKGTKFSYAGRMLFNISFSSFLIIALSFMNRNLSFSRLVFVYSWIFTFLFLTFARIIIVSIQRSMEKEKSVILIGDYQSLPRVLSEIQSSKVRSWKIKGVISDRRKNFTVPFLGSISQFFKTIKRFKADLYLLSLDGFSEIHRLRLIGYLKKKQVDYLIIPSFYELVTGQMETQDIFNYPFLEPLEEPFRAEERLIKILFDRVFSFFTLIFLSPFFILMSGIIFLTMGSPVIYRQKRVGKNGRLFTIYKFRTMVKNADRAGPVLTRKNDNRVTGLGRFLRRFSLDELPQFVNVLKGDMSLVGPRPEVPQIVHKYNEWQKEVLKVRPGITGLAQISGRQDLTIARKLRLDIYYIKNYSFFLDFKIIFQTILVIFRSRGVY